MSRVSVNHMCCIGDTMLSSCQYSRLHKSTYIS